MASNEITTRRSFQRISSKFLLNFLHVSYQVQETIDNASLCVFQSYPSPLPRCYMSVVESVTNHRQFQCLLINLLGRETINLWVTGALLGKPPVTSGFPSQRASNSENVSMSWHVMTSPCNSQYNSVRGGKWTLMPLPQWIIVSGYGLAPVTRVYYRPLHWFICFRPQWVKSI